VRNKFVVNFLNPRHSLLNALYMEVSSSISKYFDLDSRQRLGGHCMSLREGNIEIFFKSICVAVDLTLVSISGL
jgi:hypothetical protein